MGLVYLPRCWLILMVNVGKHIPYMDLIGLVYSCFDGHVSYLVFGRVSWGLRHIRRLMLRESVAF